VAGAEQVRHVADRGGGQFAQGLGLDAQDFSAVEFDGGDVLVGELAVGGLVVAHLEHGLVFELGHRWGAPRKNG
jgi:hypothetical protein